ncbi:MAG TPA: hypothetical protein EYP85_11670 [Armatimonadetes bacterium]|nr:hypothetical protein [Armatimonadota bacterium]
MIIRDLTPERRRELLEAIARRIVDYRLETPAVFFLELHKPLAFLGSQAFLAASPLLTPFIGPERMEEYAELMSRPENVEALIQRIEELATEGGDSR